MRGHIGPCLEGKQHKEINNIFHKSPAHMKNGFGQALQTQALALVTCSAGISSCLLSYERLLAKRGRSDAHRGS